ncbi:MAG: hypothetical protein GXY86_03100 [Firmicutes bacterium]|nr:hypothetical protein [Bacillota bacterium]
MKVVVIGKEHVSGKSRKTGNPFDSNIVHVSYKKNGVTGEACESIWLSPDSYPLSSIEVGKQYNLDRDSRGFVCGFDKA